MKNAVTNIWDSIKSAISDKISGIVDTIKSGFDTAKNYVTGLASEAWNWGADIIDGIVDGIQSKVQDVADAVTGVADKIRSFLHFSVPDEGPLTDFESWMPDFMQGLADGINRSKKLVSNAVNGVAEAVSLTMHQNMNYSFVPAASAGGVVNNYYTDDHSKTVNQTNNSPKALSRLEIYRQTRNVVKE